MAAYGSPKPLVGVRISRGMPKIFIGGSPSGKASDFDSDIRWFDPITPCQMLNMFMDIQKLESISKIIAAVLIPLAVAYMGNQISVSNKKQESQTKLVEVATGILEKDIPKNQTADQRELRRWAVAVVNTYSGIQMPKEVENALVESIALPVQRKTDGPSGPWGVVFGSDKTVGQALWEIRGAEKKVEVRGGQISYAVEYTAALLYMKNVPKQRMHWVN